MRTTRTISGLTFGAADRKLAAYYRQVVRDHYRVGLQLAFRYY